MKIKKRILILIILLCTLSGCNSKQTEELNDETNGMLNFVPKGMDIEGIVLEITGTNQIYIKINKQSNTNFKVGENVYINFDEVQRFYYATNDNEQEWEDVEKSELIIEEDAYLKDYFSKLDEGDIVNFDFEKGDVLKEDGETFINCGVICRDVYDPHLDPIFEEKNQ